MSTRIDFDFYPDDEFLQGAVLLDGLSQWATSKGLLLLPMSTRAAGADVVGVQTYLQAISEEAVASLSEKQALRAMSDLLEARPDYPCHPKERVAVLDENDTQTARYMLKGSVWVTWRDLIRRGLDAGELSLFHMLTMAPLAWPGAASQITAFDDANPQSAQPTKETKEQREDRRLNACINAGLPMADLSEFSRLPDGVGAAADREGVSRQTFSQDIKGALARFQSAKKAGSLVHGSR